MTGKSARTARTVLCSLIPLALLVSLVVILAATEPAAAVVEPNHTTPSADCGLPCHEPSARPYCTNCHEYPLGGEGNWFTGPWGEAGPYAQIGPHGLYTTGTSRCDMCHTLHDAPTGFKLLPGATVQATCFSCHDGTGGQGVYGAISARGLTAGGGHAIESTTVIPGGSAANGGSSTAVFRGTGGTLTCSDCHSPHGTSTVEKFVGERVRIYGSGTLKPPYTTKLLKRKPTGASTETADYGSDWCLGCHKGRASGGAVMNHPVDSSVATANPYVYDRIPAYYTFDDGIFNGALAKANGFEISTLGGIAVSQVHNNSPERPGNTWAMYRGSGWLMAYPRNALQAGHGPICQQCHEDSRQVGYLSADGTEVWMRGDTIDGLTADGQVNGTVVANPRFQNFPHETQNANMLLETGDDLCLNCHPPAVLP